MAYKYTVADYRRIRRLYLKGYSFPEIRRWLGVSYDTIYKALRRGGGRWSRTRSISEAKLLKTKGWRKLTRMVMGNTRVLSLPKSIRDRVKQGAKYGQWKVSGKKIYFDLYTVRPSGKYVYKLGEQELILALPVGVLKTAGWDARKPLMGKWSILHGRLRLRVKYV